METIFMNSEKSKTSEPHKFKLDLTDKRNLKNSNKNMNLANLSVYYTWKNIKSEYNNNTIQYNKFKISAPTWNDIFDLPDGLILSQIFRIIYHQKTRKFDRESTNSNLPK